MQDQITEAVVGVLEPAIQQAEIERTRRKRPENLNAYDHYLRSLALTNAFTREAAQEMLEGCLHAISLDPSFAPAYALAARAYVQRLTQGWIVDEPKEYAEVLDLVERGLRADRLDPFMLGTAGQCFAWFERDLSKGIAYIDEAISINPNFAHGFMQSGLVRIQMGEARIAIDHLERARRLSPRDSRNYAIFHGLATAYHLDGNPETACDWARRSVQHNPNYLPGWIALASSAAMTGREVEARMAAEHVLALEPAYTIQRGAQRLSDQRPGEIRASTTRSAPRRASRMSEQRRLAAILVADVVGYSKLVGSDEAGTLAQLADAAVRRHRARDCQARRTAVQGSRRRLPG